MEEGSWKDFKKKAPNFDYFLLTSDGQTIQRQKLTQKELIMPNLRLFHAGQDLVAVGFTADEKGYRGLYQVKLDPAGTGAPLVEKYHNLPEEWLKEAGSTEFRLKQLLVPDRAASYSRPGSGRDNPGEAILIRSGSGRSTASPTNYL